MAGFQQTIIIGNVGRDPEFKYTPNGLPVCNFSVAVSRKWGGKDGTERQEETTWFRVACWRNLAEIANQYVRKGTQIMVVGRIKARAYQDNNNQTQVSLELDADNFQMLGGRGEGDSSGGNYSGGQQGGAENGGGQGNFQPQQNYGGGNINDTDVPF